jgi:hypothetical protein
LKRKGSLGGLDVVGVLLKWTVNEDNIKVDIILKWGILRVSGLFDERKQGYKFY